MNVVAFKGEVRTDLGKKATKAVRSEGKIPAVLYGGEETIHFTTTHKDVKPIVFTPDFKIAEVDVDGKTYRCIVKDIQWHPVSDEIQHIDFLRLIDGHPIKLEVPVHFVGSAPGVRAGGKLQQTVRRVKIKTTPENMVDELKLDVSKLEMGQSIRVRDITAIEGVEILAQPGTPVALVEIPRALRSAATAAAKEARTAGTGGNE
ncbi:MAG: 50S ribosomal protein L25 [Lewinella sp.]|nr:50S ribosomal protein L25 [Lewinella sp.]